MTTRLSTDEHPSGSPEPVALVMRPWARERKPVPGAPQLSHARGQILRRIQIVDQYADHRWIDVPVERPITVLVDGVDVGTLWTLGASPECLVLGYLWNQRLVTNVTALESIAIDWLQGTAKVTTHGGNGATPQLLGAPSRIGTEENGLVTRDEALACAPLQSARISRATLLSILQSVPEKEAVYRTAGSVHGCALFCGADLWLSVEDVSRRNTIDTITGWMALHGVAGADKILFTTGRFTAEIVMKAAYSGIPILVSRKGLTATSHDLAQRLGVMLFGHAAPGRYVCYTGIEGFDVT